MAGVAAAIAACALGPSVLAQDMPPDGVPYRPPERKIPTAPFLDHYTLPVPQDILHPGTLREALEESIRRHRVLIVVLEDMPNIPGRRHFWENELVRAWVKWHAIVVYDDEQARVLQLVRRTRQENHYGVALFYRGKFVRMASPRRRDEDFALFKPRPTASAIGLLFGLDLTTEMYCLRDLVWSMMHDKLNPMPQPPEPEPPLWLTGDENADGVADLEAPPGTVPDVLARLAEARRLAADGALADATGLYTWLWERGAEVDPAFGPVRVAMLPQEVRPIVAARPGTKARVAMLGERLAARNLWATHSEQYEALSLTLMADDHAAAVRWLSTELLDLDMASLHSREELRVYSLMAERLGNPGTPESTLAWARAQHKELQRPRPSTRTLEKHKMLQDFRRWLLVQEACAAYAAALQSGSAAAAPLAQLAQDVGGPEVLRALVMSALAQGQAREEHLRWLADAAGAAPLQDDPLARRVAAMLRGIDPDSATFVPAAAPAAAPSPRPR